MRRTFVRMATCLLLAAAPATGAPKAVVTNPDWLSRPSGEDMGEHYPALAARLEIEGRAVVACTVNADGLLVGCTSTFEEPADLGFGAAALAMTPLFKMRPQTLNGKPVDGGEVRIPIRFNPPPDEGGPPPEVGSPESLRQALRLVDATPTVEKSIEPMAALDPDTALGVTAATREAAAEALRTASRAHRDELRNALARAFASVFSDGEMAALADFAEGPGKRMQNNSAATAAQGQVQLAYMRNRRAAAHDAFCAKQACAAPAELERVWRPTDPRDTRLDNPQWAAQPSAEDVLQAEADLAEAIGVNGVVRLTCKVAKGGGLEACAVDEQAPGGLGFGEAALALTGQYRLSPIQMASSLGRKVTVRVGFPSPELGDPPTPLKAPSERAATLARQVMERDEVTAATQRETELQILNFQSPPPKGANAKTVDAAIEAYRAGGLAALDTAFTQNADALAATYSIADLEALAAFHATPAAKAQRERQDALNVALVKAATYVAEQVTADARASFCATRGCRGGGPASGGAATSRTP